MTSKRPKQAHIQNRILLSLSLKDEKSLTALARKLNTHRSSVSRAMHALQEKGLVENIDGHWTLTVEGELEAQRIESQFFEQVANTTEAISTVLDKTEEVGATLDIIAALSQTAPLKLISDAALSNLDETVRLLREPLLRAAASVDLITSMHRSMQSIADMTKKMDSTFGSVVPNPLLNTAMGIDLLSSARDSMQSVTSLMAKTDLRASIEPSEQILLDAAIRFGSVTSAQDAISPIVSASDRFDSLLRDVAISKSLSEAFDQTNTAAIARATIMPLIEAATRFDSIALPNFALDLPSMELDDRHILGSAYKQWEESVNTGVSSQIALLMDSISAYALKPSINEIAASNTLNFMDDLARSTLPQIGSSLAQEMYENFSQSSKLSSALVKQLTDIDHYMSTSIYDELLKTNSELNRVVTSLEDFRVQDFYAGAAGASFASQLPYLAEVGRTFKGYLADATHSILHANLPDHVVYNELVIPTRSTTSYVESIYNPTVYGEPDLIIDSYPDESSTQLGDYSVIVVEALQPLGTNFVSMWIGSLATLRSDNPDRIRQSAHSGRELLMQFLAKLAPDESFDKREIEENGSNGRVTRSMRLKKIMPGSSDSKESWVDSMVNAFDNNYKRLVAASHERGEFPRVNSQQLAGYLMSLGGLLIYIMGCLEEEPE